MIDLNSFIHSGIIFLIAEIVCLALCFIYSSSRIIKIVSLCLCIIVFVLTLFGAVLFSLTGELFNGMVYTQIMRGGIIGSQWGDFDIDIMVGICILVLFFLTIYRIQTVSLKYRYPYAWLGKILLILQCTILIGHPVVYSIYDTLHVSAPNVLTNGIENHFYVPEGNIEFPEKKKNVVWIYAESLERTFMNEDIFPGLMPNLKKLEGGGEGKSISFTNIEQATLMSSTVTGLVASQCGNVFLYGENKGEIFALGENKGGFMSNVLCMGDILKKGGYIAFFMQAAVGTYARHDEFFAAHNIDLIAGEKIGKMVDEKDIVWWGATDDVLLDLASKKYSDLLDTNQSFFLGISTINTHFPNGNVPDAYKEHIYQDGSNSMLNAVHVSDMIISEFVQRIKSLDIDNNTIIIISSDHLAKKNTATDMLEASGNRRNLLMYLLPDNAKKEFEIVGKHGTTLDNGVTTLDIMGIGIKKMGLGRSLLRKDHTLIEIMGDSVKNLNESLNSWVKLPHDHD